MRDVLLLIDVFNTFDHDDGEALLASFRERLPRLRTLVARARASDVPVVYVNDVLGRWDSDAPGLVRTAIEGLGGDVARRLVPEPGDRFLLKPRYSAFDHTPLVILLRELEAERLLLAGAATEMCLVQSAIDARELGFLVTIVADACASPSDRMEELALVYAREIVGARVRTVDEVDPGREEPD